MSCYPENKLKATALSIFLATGIVLSTSANSDAIDGKINHHVSYGGLLNKKLEQLEQQQQDLSIQKNQLDTVNAQLEKDQEIYNNNSQRYNEQVDIHNQKILATNRECRSSGPEKNLDQLAQAADNASLGFSGYGSTNPDAREQEEYTRKCRAKITQVNSATSHMAAEKYSLSDQQQSLEKRSMDYDTKAATWNRQEALTENALNDVYKQINTWQNESEYFMASDAFQHKIAEAHANKICSMPDVNGSSQEKLTQINNYILSCMRVVENR